MMIKISQKGAQLRKSNVAILGVAAVLGLSGVIAAAVGMAITFGDFVLGLIAAVLAGMFVELTTERWEGGEEKGQPHR